MSKFDTQIHCEENSFAGLSQEERDELNRALDEAEEIEREDLEAAADFWDEFFYEDEYEIIDFAGDEYIYDGEAYDQWE